MATNHVNDGSVINYNNTGSAISAGDVVEVGNQIGIALVDIAATTGSGAVALEGVYDIAKVDGAVIAEGESLLWDTSAQKVDDNAAIAVVGDYSNCLIAMEAKGTTTSETIKVKINVGVCTVT